MRLNLGEIARLLMLAPESVLWTDGAHLDDKPAWAEWTVTGGQMDSRLIVPGNLFFCLSGQQVDGHDYAKDAAKAGAIAIIASRNPFANGESQPRLPVFLVSDVLQALWQVAKRHRDTASARVIGLTGTAGKTSVKEVLSKVLAIHGHTESSAKNFNNQIGLPVSMLNASAEAAFWVMEVGISEARDMAELGDILRPDLALVLNVGEGHVQGLGDLGVAAHKARLLDYIRPGGVAVVSGDYPDLTAEVLARQDDLADRGIQRVVFSAEEKDADFTAAYLGEGQGSHGRYRIKSKEAIFVVNAPFKGDFGAENAAAIAATASVSGLSQAEMERGFFMAQPPLQRFCISRHGDCLLADDSYNANPLSAMRMLAASSRMAGDKGCNLVLVMGEMLELGELSPKAHFKLGLSMGCAAPKAVFWTGGHGAEVSRGLAESGYTGPFHTTDEAGDFAALFDNINLDNMFILFKGSRSNKLERFVDIARKKLGDGGDGDAL